MEVGKPSTSAARRGPRSRAGLKQPRVGQLSAMLVAVTTSPIVNACVPAHGGEFPESPRAFIVQVITALPSNSAENTVEILNLSLGCVWTLTPVDSGNSPALK